MQHLRHDRNLNRRYPHNKIRSKTLKKKYGKYLIIILAVYVAIEYVG